MDFPVTLYNEDVRRLSQPTNKVLAIFMKHYNQQSYIECTYLSKGQQINKLPVKDDIKELFMKLQEAEEAVKDERVWMSLEELKASVGV